MGKRILLTLMVLIVPVPIFAGVIVDDHFTGNAGNSNPTNWVTAFGTGTVNESGTVLTLTNSADADPFALRHASTFDPRSTTTTMAVTVSSLSSGNRSALFGVAGPGSTGIVLLDLNENGDLTVQASPNGPSNLELANVTTVSSATNLTVTLVFDNDSFRVTTSEGFSGADTAYSSVFTNFANLDSFGTSTSAVVAAGGSSSDSVTVGIDRVTLQTADSQTGATIPEPSSLALLAFCSGLFGLRRRR